MGPALVTNTFPYHVTLVTDASELPEIVGAVRATTRSRYVLCSYSSSYVTNQNILNILRTLFQHNWFPLKSYVLYFT